MLNFIKSLFGAGGHDLMIILPTTEEFPNEKELQLRNDIIDALDAKRVGKFTGAGAGLGSMDIEYSVKDPEAAKQEIVSVIDSMPANVEYRIETL